MADADLNDMFAWQRFESFEPLRQLRITSAGQNRHSHPIEESGGRCFGRIEISMRIEPDDRGSLWSQGGRRSQRGHAAVAAKNNRSGAARDGLLCGGACAPL